VQGHFAASKTPAEAHASRIRQSCRYSAGHTISHVENGLETMKLRTLMHLLRALDLEITVQPRTKGSHREIEELF